MPSTNSDTPSSTNGTTNAPSTTASSSDQLYQQQIENLTEQLASKEKQMSDLQRGLEAQVHMVMELEELEQKELNQYELKIDANKRLIGELGDRVGQESKQKAELESQLNYCQLKCEDQAKHIQTLEETHQANTQVIQALQDQNGEGQDSKLDFLLNSNQKLVMELAQAQEDIQKVRREGTDKDLLCLELSSQLDKLAQQLNQADESQAKVKNEVIVKGNALKRAEERVQMLEKSMMEAPPDDDKQGINLIIKHLKQKEEQCEQLQKERDASLHKATKLSLALASSREHVDALQEKLDYQNSIVDRILRKRNSNPSTPTVAAATKDTPRRFSSFEKKKIGRSFSGGTGIAGKATTPTNNPNNTNNDHANAPGKFDGRRIRSFFNRGRANSSGGTPHSTANSPANSANNTTSNGGSPVAAGTTTTAPPTRGLFKRKSSNESDKNSQAGKETNPFDDDQAALFTNESVGKVHQLEEDCQGGGGDVNLALTL